MLKALKKQARSTVLKNYKSIFPLVLLYGIFSAIKFTILDYWSCIFFFQGAYMLLLPALIVVSIIIIPILGALFFKSGVLLENGDKISFSSLKSFLSKENIKKIILINLFPSIIDLISAVFRYYKSSFESAALYNILNIAILTVVFFANYKFFICNYCFALNEKTVKETLKVSFNTMHSKFFKFLKYDLSFILWYLLFFATIIVVGIISKQFKIDTFLTNLLLRSYLGIALYYLPYRFMVDFQYAKKLLSDE